MCLCDVLLCVVWGICPTLSDVGSFVAAYEVCFCDGVLAGAF